MLGSSQVNEIVNQHTMASKELDVIFESYLAVEPRSACYCLVPGRASLSSETDVYYECTKHTPRTAISSLIKLLIYVASKHVNLELQTCRIRAKDTSITSHLVLFLLISYRKIAPSDVSTWKW